MLYHVGRVGVALGGEVGTTRYVDRLPVDDDQNLRESTFEAVRQAEFARLPSRNRVVFAWEELSMARRWLADGIQAGKPEGYESIYIVSPPEGATTFRGDYGWLALSFASLDELEVRARSYWSGLERTGNSAWEVLVEGPLTVVGEVPPAA